MIREIYLELFRFDAETDYLPYYKKVVINEVDGDEPLFEFLNRIAKSVDSYAMCEELRINGKVVMDLSIKLDEVVGYFGNTLRIDPLSERNAVKDLNIDDADYYSKVEKLNEIIELDSEDQKMADKYRFLNYVSEISLIDRDYLGEGVLMLLEFLAQKYPTKKMELYQIIASEDGVINFSGIKNRVFPKCEKYDEILFDVKKKVYSGFPVYDKDRVEYREYVEGLFERVGKKGVNNG